VRARYRTCLREQHKKAAARAASTNGSGGHWEQGLCSGVGSLRFSCDLKGFRHVASIVSAGAPLSPSILTLGIRAGLQLRFERSTRGRYDHSTLAADYQYWISVSVPPDSLAPGEPKKSPSEILLDVRANSAPQV